ncbi:MAG: hypothetical protein RL518_1421 [Pseudomonadota bacterium]|jgi:hypothetical protein
MKGTTRNVSLLSVLLLCNGCVAAIPMMGAAGLPGLAGLSSFIDQKANAKAAPSSDKKDDMELVGIDSEVPELMNELVSGKKLDIASVLADDVDGVDEALARSERGRLAQIQGDLGTSISELTYAVDKVEDFDSRALVNLRNLGAQAAALVVNDNMIPYEPAGFEKVLVYHFQALNYLMDGKVEDAGVEVRRANAEQEAALKAHEEEVAEAEEEAKGKGFSAADFQDGVAKSLGSSRAVAALVKNSFQNAYTFYMSGVVHEIMNEPNDAYIDYKKALEIAPTNGVIQRDVARLAKALSMTDDSEGFKKRFPAAFGAAKDFDRSKNEVIVFFEDGVVPGKQAIWFPIPIPIPGSPGLTSIAIPTFKASVAPVRPLTLSAGGAQLGSSERICAIDALAVKAYEESAPSMIARQVVRAAIKGAASSLASHYGGNLAGLAVSAVGVATEIADTRSWRSLPQNAQVIRTQVAPGSTLNLVHDGSGARGTISVPNQGGKRVVVRAVRLGSKLFISNVVI